MIKAIEKTLRGAMRLFALALGLAWAGSAWAATPVAVWDGDFGTTTKNGITFNANGNTVASDGSTVTIASSATTAPYLSLPTTYQYVAVAFTVSGLSPAANGIFVVLGAGNSPNLAGVFFSGDDALTTKPIAGGSAWSGTDAEATIGSITAGTGERTFVATYDSSSAGLHVYEAGSADAVFGSSNNNKLRYSSYKCDTIAIGGGKLALDSGTSLVPTPGLVIKKIAVYTSASALPLTASDMAAYTVPSQTTITVPSTMSELNTAVADATGVVNFTGFGTAVQLDAEPSDATKALLQDSSAWYGTVLIKDVNKDDIVPSSYGNPNSTLKLSGVSGYFAKAQYTSAVTPEIELENSATSGYEYGFKQTNGYSFNSGGGYSYVNTPKLKGSGTLWGSWNGLAFYVADDYSEFTGVLNLASGNAVWLGVSLPATVSDAASSAQKKTVTIGGTIPDVTGWTVDSYYGTVTMTNAADATETAFLTASAWKGTCQINMPSRSGAFDIVNYGNANSVIEIIGLAGYPTQNNGADAANLSAELRLTGTWTVGDGWTNKTTTFAKVTGGGTITVNGGTGSSTAIPYTITKLEGFTGTLAGTRGKFTIGTIVSSVEPTAGTKLVNCTTTYAPVLTDTVVTYGGATQGDVMLAFKADDGIYAAVASSGDAGYATVQAAIDSVADEGSVTLKADCDEALTLADGKTVTIVATSGNNTYTYNAPTAATPESYAVAATAVENGTTYASIAYYVVTIPTVANTTVSVNYTSGGAAATSTAAGAINVDAGTDVTIAWTAADGYKITAGATQTISAIAADATATAPTVEEKGAAVSNVTFAYGSDYTNATVTATVTGDATTATLTYGGTTYNATSFTDNGDDTYTATFSGVEVPARGADIYASSAYTVGTDAHTTTGGEGTTVVATTAAGWINESATASGTGAWTTNGVAFTPAYEATSLKAELEDATFTATTASDGDIVKVTATLCFCGENNEELSGAKAAVKIGDVNDVATFMVWAGEAPAWTPVSATGLTASYDADYSVEITIDYRTGKYSVKVGDYQLAATDGGATEFDLASTATSVQAVEFNGYGEFTSLYGEYTEGNMVQGAAGKYATVADAIAAYSAGTDNGPFTMLHAGTAPEGWTISGTTLTCTAAAKTVTADVSPVTTYYATLQGAIDATKREAAPAEGDPETPLAIVLLANNDEAVTLENGYKAIVNAGTYTYTAPVPVTEGAYTIDAVVDEQDEHVTTYTARDWYEWTLTLVNANGATVTGITDSQTVSESSPGVTFTVTPAANYHLNGVTAQVAGEEAETLTASEGTYSYTLTNSVTITVDTAIDTYTVTFVDEDGTTVLKAATAYDYGTAANAIAEPETPAKAATAQYTYTFAGWDPELAPVTENATYTATYSSTVNNYTITWSIDGVETTETLAYGATPAYDGTPAKAATAEYTYAFTGWSPAIADVTGDQTYTAQFSATLRSYGVTFSWHGGEDTKSYDYGTPAANVVIPSAPATYVEDSTIYTFSGWNPAAVADVTGPATYEAQYTSAAAVAYTTDGGATTNYYATLAEAVGAASDGDTVVLLANVTLDARVEPNVGANTTLTIDLGGHTITRTGTSGNGSAFDVKSGDVTIQNGVIDCTQDDTAIVSDGVYAITSRSGSNVTLADLTVTVDSECGACAYPFAGSTLTIESGTYANVTTTPYRYNTAITGMAVNQPNNATQNLFIEGGTFSQYDPQLGDDSGAMTDFTAAGYVAIDDGSGNWVVQPGWNVTFDANGGTPVPEAQRVAADGTATEPATAPAKAADAQYTYAFDKWLLNDAAYDFTAAVASDITLVATFTETVNEYTISWDTDGDGEVDDTTTVAYGTVPTHADGSKEATAQYTYTFTGWDSTPVAVTGEATYTAQFSSTVNQYNVTFVDEDGETVLKAATAYDYGTAAADVAKPADPTKASTAQYTYTFAGWTPEVAEVTADATYRATYTQADRTYLVTFVDEDGETVLQSGSVAYGVTPSYTGETPAKASTAQYTYAFGGWTPAIEAVSGAATYTATYTETLRSYTITFTDHEGTVSETVCDYGTTPTAPTSDPRSYAEGGITYVGTWPEVAAVTGDATYAAVYVAQDASVVIGAATFAYGADYTNATVTVAVDETNAAGTEYTLTYGEKTYTATSVNGTVTFEGVEVPREGAYGTVSYTITTPSVVSASGATSGTATVQTATAGWINESATASGTGAWSPEISYGATGKAELEDATFTATAASAGDIVRIEANGVCFGGDSDVNIGEAQAAVKVMTTTENEVETTDFYVYAGNETWTKVAASGVEAGYEAEYNLVITIDYTTGKYSATVNGTPLAAAADGATTFDLARTATSVQTVTFNGNGAIESLYGEYYEGNMVKGADGTKYATVADAIAAVEAGTATTPLTMLHAGTAPEGWTIDGTTLTCTAAAKTVTADATPVTTYYATLQGAINATKREAEPAEGEPETPLAIVLLANNAEAVTLENGYKAIVNAGTYTYTAPVPVTEGAYTIDAVVDEQDEHVTTYTARDWYTWTLSLGATSSANATVTGLPANVAENAADKSVTFTVTPAATYKVTSVTVGETTLTGVNGTYTYTVSGNAEVVVTTELDVATVTFMSEDGQTTLQSGDVTIGETPAYTGETPTKAATDEYVYTFAGWAATQDGEVLAALPAVAAGGATYYAVFTTYTKVEKPTAVTGLVYDGTEKTGVVEGTGYTLTGNTATAPGSYTATATLATGYVWSDGTTAPVEISWSIGRRGLRIILTDAGKTYGGQDPALTYTVEGLVGTDSLSGAPARAAGENAGTYAITQGTLAAGDVYEITEVAGATFTIAKAALTVTADDKFVVRGNSVAYTVTYSGFVNDETESVLTASATATSSYDPEALSDTTASYAISASGAEADNYTFTYADGTLTISAAVAEVGGTYYAALADAVAAATDGSTVTLLADVNEAIVNAADKSFTIDLNGQTWSSDGDVLTTSAGHITIEATNGGTMTTEAAQCCAVWAKGGDVVIDGGTFQSKDYEEATIYVSDANSVITINGGTFENTDTRPYRWKNSLHALTLNVKNDLEGQHIVINGGTFIGNDPQLGDDTAGGNYAQSSVAFVSSGYVAIQDGSGNWVVQRGYNVTFVNYDGTELQTLRVPVDGAVAYSGETPARPTTESAVYTFSGWDSEIASPAVADATYTAQFSSIYLDPASLAINYNCYGTVAVSNAPAGATFFWTMYTNDVAFASLSGPLPISSGKTTSALKFYAQSTPVTDGWAVVSITNGAEVITLKAPVTVKDVAAVVDGVEYAKADLDAAGAAALAGGKTLGLYVNGPTITLAEGQTLVSQVLSERNTPTPSVKAPAGTAEKVYTVNTAIDNATKTRTYTLTYDTPTVMYTSTDGQTVEYLDAKFKMSKDGTYKLLKDVERAQLSVGNVAAVLDLNGHEFSSTVTGSKGAIYVDSLIGNASLTIRDTAGGGSIVAENCFAIWGNRNATIAIEGGEIVGKNDVVYLSNAADTLTITGGTFRMASGSANFMLNMLDSARGTITVTGGSFQGFDPANNAAEGAGTSFLPATGYVSVADDPSAGWYTVHPAATVVWNVDGVETTNVVAIGSATAAVQPADPTKSGFAFNGWTPAVAETVTADATYTATWLEVVEIPTAVTGLVYDGTEKTGVVEGTGYTLTGNKATAAGDYTATATLATGYVWSDGTTEPVEINWSIRRKGLRIIISAVSKTYGDADPEFAYTTEGLAEGDDVTGSATREEGENAGTYAITQGTLAASGNYEVEFVGANLTIGKATVTVTAQDKSVVRGNTVAYTVTYSGFVNDETEAVLTTAATAGSDYDPANASDTTASYAISASGAEADNYTFTYADGTLTISAAVAAVGGTYYAALADAVAAATDGSTVTLLADVTLDARVEPNVGANTTLTIDLGGKTITRTGTSGNGSAFDVKSGAVTIQNGVIDCTQDDTAIAADGVYAITSRSGSNVTLAGLTVTVDSECGACAYPFAGSTMTIKSGTYANVTTTPYRYNTAITGMAVNQPNEATKNLFIEGGSFSQYDPQLGDDSGKMTDFTADGYVAIQDGSGNWVVQPGYNVTFVNYDGTELETLRVPVDGAVAYSGETPVMPATSSAVYTFSGWDSEVASPAVADATYTAQFSSIYLDPASLELYPNCSNYVYVVGAPEGSTYTYKFAGQVGCDSYALNPPGWSKTEGWAWPYGKQPGGTGTITVTVTNDNAQIAVLTANVTVKDVAAVVDGVEYASADFANALAAAKSGDKVLEMYYYMSSYGKVALAEGESIRWKPADNRGKGSFWTSAATIPATTDAAWYKAVASKDNETGVTTITCVNQGVPYVKIDDGTTVTYSTESFTSMSKAGTTYTLLRDMTNQTGGAVSKSGVVLDLNGKKLGLATGIKVAVNSAASLTIRDTSQAGTGEISGGNDSSPLVWVTGGGTATIESGTFVSDGTTAVYTENGTASIAGGTFSTTAADKTYLLNCKDSNKETITVTGGSFQGFNPQNNTADGEGTDYVATGYVSVADDPSAGWYTVHPAATVVWNVDGVETTNVVAIGSATAAITPADPTKTGYSFTGWTPAVAETVTADATYTATWYEIVGGEAGLDASKLEPGQSLSALVPITAIETNLVEATGCTGWKITFKPVLKDGLTASKWLEDTIAEKKIVIRHAATLADLIANNENVVETRVDGVLPLEDETAESDGSISVVVPVPEVSDKAPPAQFFRLVILAETPAAGQGSGE